MAPKANDWTGMTVSDGRYLVKKKLGEGGMGIVYHAQDTRLGMDVVIKVPRQAMLDEPEFADRFASEIRSLVRLSHPNIVKVTDVGEYNGLPFAIMQYLPGGSLEDRQLTVGGQPAAADAGTVPGWLQGVACALDYIHSQGYVHRDVKPGNILFDSQGYAFLGDFGVIKALAATEVTRSKTVTGAGLVLGTPDYMAPELIMGGQIDGRADQYALAVTVYEMLCGRRPFAGSSSTAVLVLHTTQPPPPMNAIRPDLADRLSRAVLKGLAKDRTQRYPTCAAFAGAVVAALEASPVATAGVSAPPPASTQSVQIQCPSCGKPIAMGVQGYNTLKRTGQGFPCPACQQSIQVASPRTQVLNAPALNSGFPSTGTQKLPTMGPAATSRPGPAGGPSRTTQKIALPNQVPGQGTAPAPKNRPTAPTLFQAQTQLLPQSQGQGAPSPKPSRLPWIGIAAAAALLLIAAVAFLILPRRSREANVPRPGNAAPGADLLVRADPDREPRPVETPTAPEKRTEPAAPPALPPPPPPAPTPAAVAPAAPAPTPEPAPGPPPVLPAAPAPGDSAPVPDPVATITSDENKPDAVPPSLANSPRPGATKNADKTEDPPALEEILAAPEKFGDREIAPKGLFRVSKLVSYAADGTPSIAVIHSGLSVKQTGPQIFEVVRTEWGETATLEVDRGVADRFIANNVAIRGSFSTPSPGTWEKNLAVLTLRVLRSSGLSQGTGWVCRLVKAEFLINLDGQRIGDHKPAKAFQTYTMSPGAEGLGVGKSEEWQKRLGTRFMTDLGKLARLLKAQQSKERWAAFNQQMGAMLQSTVQSSSAAAAAGEAARRNAIFGR